jgi:hypothetical protein
MRKKQPVINTLILEDADLADIRQRLGAKDENDSSYDDRINKMTAEELVAKKSGWELGDESWGESYVEIYRQLVAKGVRTAA